VRDPVGLTKKGFTCGEIVHRAVARHRIASGLLRGGDWEAAARKLEEAEADLNAALNGGASPVFVLFARSKVRDARGDFAGAEADRKATEGLVLTTEEDFLASGWSRLERDPKAAEADFQKALVLNPRSVVALRNLAYLYTGKLPDLQKALAVYDRIIEVDTESAVNIAARALVLARLGRREESHRGIELARVKSNDAEILYLAASVYSLTSGATPADRAEAVALVRETLNKNPAKIRGMQTDPNFGSLRDDPAVQEIFRAAATLQNGRPPLSLLQEVARAAKLKQ